MKSTQNCILACCVAASLLSTQALQANITVTAEPAGDNTSIVPGVTSASTVTFDSAPIGSVTSYVTPIGTFTGGNIFGANQYGGAGGTGHYYVVGDETRTVTTDPGTLTFNSPQSYVGLWWSAMDPQNSLTIKLQNGTSLVYNTTGGGFDVESLLSSSYLGDNPGSYNGQDSGEYFAYLNFTDTGSPITSIVLSDGNDSTGFEVDNISILSKVPDAANSGLLLLVAAGALIGYRQTRSGRSLAS